MAQTPVSLLTLPAELRNAIYEEVFMSDASSDTTTTPSESLQPLLVCRQIYNEAGLLAFSRTRFIIFMSSCTNFDWEGRTARLRAPQLNAIRSIKLCFRPDAKAALVSYYAPQLRHVLDCFTGVDSVCVDNNVAHATGRRARIANAALILDFARHAQNNVLDQGLVWRLRTTDSDNKYELVNVRLGTCRTVQLEFVKRTVYLKAPWRDGFCKMLP